MMINQNQQAGNNQAKERHCYTVEEVMEVLGVGRKTVYSLIRKKLFPLCASAVWAIAFPRKAFRPGCTRRSANDSLTAPGDRLKIWRL